MEWYNVFSYWGFGVWFLWLAGFPIEPLSIVLANLLFSILFVVSKYKGLPPIAFFILGTHMIPLYSLRHSPMKVEPLVIVYVAYMSWLAVQGLDPIKVYKSMFDEPPLTIREYLERRNLL
jgi:hypothetical protein